MNEESVDSPATEPAPARDALAGTAPRDRATPEGDGLDPTRYGDWEKNGRCIDFRTGRMVGTRASHRAKGTTFAMTQRDPLHCHVAGAVF